MKLNALPQPVEHPIGDTGLAVIVTHVGDAQNGLRKARMVVWNGRPLAGDVIEPTMALDRRRLAKAAVKADPDLGVDATEIDAAILACGETLYQIEMPTTNADDDDDRKPRLSANFPGLVDIVVGIDGRPSYLIVDETADTGVAMVDEIEQLDTRLVPPPIDALPWRLPRADEVLRHLHADDDRELFDAVVTTIKRHALLPLGPVEYPDAYADLEAAFVFHTHYPEPAAYSPELELYAVPERGKSRNGRTLTYLCRRGIHTETLREANLFRDSQDRGATLFLDCTKLWTKLEKAGSEDILLNRFERGARVGRVLYPDRGPFHDTVYYDIFGPTILASNEPLGRILDTRCVSINMPLAPAGTEYPVPDEDALLPIRERLTAWRARCLMANWQPELIAKPAHSRLGDVLLPLAQIIAKVAPDRLDGFRMLATHIEAERRRERSMSWESSIVGAVVSLKGDAINGLLPIGTIAIRVNTGRPEKEHISNKRVGEVLRSLGLTTKTAHANKAALVWDEAAIAKLAAHYGEPETVRDEDEKKREKREGPMSPGEANQPNQGNPQEQEGRDSVVSMDSFSRGDTAPTLPMDFPDDNLTENEIEVFDL